MDALVRTDSWSCRAAVAATFSQRLIGLRRGSDQTAMLFRTRSVHGFGMRKSLTAVGIDSDGLVIGVRTLEPNRVVTFLSARYVLEIPAGVAPPPLGAKVSIDDV